MHRIAIVVADAARARIFTYEAGDPAEADGVSPLSERVDLVDPERRLRPSQIHSESRPGVTHSPHGPSFAVDDHRDAHADEADRRFAGKIAVELEGVLAEHPADDVVIVASPHMLGYLRDDTAELPRRGLEVHTLALDLTRETPSQLHDHLAERGLVPARRRHHP
jgi:protein required for attachment to host cells